MTTLEIKTELLKKGITLSSIAKQVGVSVVAVSQVIHNRSVSRRIMIAVATAIDQDPKDVFPKHFKFKNVATGS